MELRELRLRSFRNYEELNISLHPGVNLILGDNAQGKTNLLEAVTYLSCGHSFRTRKERELISFGGEFSELRGTVDSYGREKELRVLLFADRRRRQLFLSGVKEKTFAPMAGQLTTVLFCPGDLAILQSGASARRKLMDDALCQLRPSYEHALGEYSRLLEHKGRILKDWHEDPSLLELLPDFNERLCRFGAEIIHTRAGYMELLGAFAGEYHYDFSGKRERLTTRYQTVSSVKDPKAEISALYGWLMEQTERLYRAELDSGQCLSGPHRDDFETLIGEQSLKSYGSQGQIRTAAISLKLGERRILRQDTGEEPVLLLDDVLSELDAVRQDFVLNQLKNGQVMITCCEKDRITDIGKTFFVEQGTVRHEE